jgi:hypothetical protein
MPRTHKLGELTKKERRILAEANPEGLKKIKTVPPGKWDQAFKDIKESVAKRGKGPSIFIYLDDADLRKLKREKYLAYGKVKLVHIKTKTKRRAHGR